MTLKSDLLHYWDLDTTSWTDSHGSWKLTSRKDSGGSDPSINNTGGPDYGKCLVLDGTNYLDRTDVAWDGSGGARSIQIWGLYTSLSTTGNWLISHRGVPPDASPLNAQLILSTSANRPSVGIADSSNTSASFSFDADLSQSADTWYHLVLTSNGTNRHRCYLDSALRGSSTTSLNGEVSSTAIAFAIGAGSWNKAATSLRHTGRACMAGIWERELSSDDVTALYNGGAGLRYSALPGSGLVMLMNPFTGGLL